ncbi:MAG: hypothetical protein AABN33_09935 [Acidobacteriota bacterium]
MTVTITIPAELEAKIAERAAAKGVTLEEYAREVLERDAEIPSLRELFAPVREQIKAAGVTDEELTAQIEEAVAEVRTRPRG